MYTNMQRISALTKTWATLNYASKRSSSKCEWRSQVALNEQRSLMVCQYAIINEMISFKVPRTPQSTHIKKNFGKLL